MKKPQLHSSIVLIIQFQYKYNHEANKTRNSAVFRLILLCEIELKHAAHRYILSEENCAT